MQGLTRAVGDTPLRLLVITLVVGLMLAMVGPAQASALDLEHIDTAESVQGSADLLSVGETVSAEQYEALFRDLTRSDMRRKTEVVDGARQVTFFVPVSEEIASEHGLPADMREFEFTMSAPQPKAKGDEGGFSTQGVGGGIDWRGPYISFGQTSQRVIAMGLGGGLIAAICGAPVVGWMACTAASTIIAGAFGYLSMNGICPGNRTLRVYFNMFPIPVPRCV